MGNGRDPPWSWERPVARVAGASIPTLAAHAFLAADV
jgi:hypothetical protein